MFSSCLAMLGVMPKMTEAPMTHSSPLNMANPPSSVHVCPTLIIELTVVAAEGQPVAGELLVLLGEAVDNRGAEDQHRGDVAKTVVQAVDVEVRHVEHFELVSDVVLADEVLHALVKRAVFVHALDEEDRDAVLDKLQRAVEEVRRSHGLGAHPTAFLPAGTW